MAVRNPEALYSGNANVFNFTPIIQYHQRQEAIKRAKEEAIDNYYRDQTKNLTPAGMRAVDIPDFIEKKNRWQNFVTQNKNFLRNPSLDKGNAAREANYLFNDVLGHSAMSVDAGKDIHEINKLRTNPQLVDLLDNDEISKGIEQSSLPVTNANYKPFNASNVQIDAKPFNTNDYLKHVTNGIKMGDLIENVETDPRTLQKTTTIKSTYDKDALENLNSRAQATYLADRKARNFVKEIEANPQLHNRLNDVFKSTYGVDIQDPSELLTAWTINSTQTQRNNQKISEDRAAQEDLKQKNKMALEGYKQRGRLNLAKIRQKFKQENLETQGYITEGYLKDLKDKQDEGVLPNTTELLKMGARQGTDGKMIQPDNVFINSNGDVKFIFNHRDSNGKLIKDDNNIVETTTEIMPRQAVKNNLAKEWTTGKQRIAEMTQPKPTTTPQETKSNNKEYFYKGKKLDLSHDPDNLFKK